MVIELVNASFSKTIVSKYLGMLCASYTFVKNCKFEQTNIDERTNVT